MNTKRFIRISLSEFNDVAKWSVRVWQFRNHLCDSGTVDDKTAKNKFFLKLILFFARLDKHPALRMPLNVAFEGYYINNLCSHNFAPSELSALRVNGQRAQVETSPFRYFKRAKFLAALLISTKYLAYQALALLIGKRLFLNYIYVPLISRWYRLLKSSRYLSQVKIFHHQGDFSVIISLIARIVYEKGGAIYYRPHGLVYDPLLQFVVAHHTAPLFDNQELKVFRVPFDIGHKELFDYSNATIATKHEKSISGFYIELYLQGFDWTSRNQSILRQLRAIHSLSRRNIVIVKPHPLDNTFCKLLYGFVARNRINVQLKQAEPIKACLYSSVYAEGKADIMLRSGSLLFCDGVR